MSINLFGYLGSGSITIGEYVVTLTPLTDGYELKVTHGADVQVGRIYGFDADGYSAIKEHVSKVVNDLAGEFSDTSTYNPKDLCVYDGDLYKCVNPVVSPGPFNPANWARTTVANELAAGSSIIDDDEITTDNAWSAHKVNELFTEAEDDRDEIQDMLSDQYNTAVAYEKGDYVIKDDKLYKCTDDTVGVWNPAKWENVKLCEELQNKKYMANEIEGLKESVDSLAEAFAKILGMTSNAGAVVWDPVAKKYVYNGTISMNVI